MRKKLLMLFALLAMASTSYAHNLDPLHVDGRYLKNPAGDIVTLHGYMTSLESWFQAEDFKFDNYDFEGALLNKKAATDSVLATGWKMDYVRFVFPDYYCFDKGDGYKGFNLGLFKKYLDEFCLPLIDYYHEKGIYTILLPPTSTPVLIENGDEFQNFLLILWDCISSHPKIRNNPGIMFELANEPVNFNCKYGIYDGLDSYYLNNRAPFKEVRDYWQPIVDKIRSHCNNIIYVPGMQWQSDFTGFADYPVMGGNIGYAIHWYPSWWGNMRKDWEEHVFPVAYMAPFVITETGWGIYEAIEGTTTNFGNPLKEIIDDLGNVSWNCWVAYEDYYYLVNDETSDNERATIANDPEVYYKPLYQWWNDYAHTKVIPTNQLKARAVSFDNFPTTVSPGKYWLARIKAEFSNGLSWDVSGDAEYTVSDESVLTIKNGVINARKEGTVTVGITYTDGTGQTFSRQFSITSTLFPLTNQGFDPNLTVETSSFDELSGTFSTEGWDFGGWTFGEGLDLSSYQYLVFQFHEPPQFGCVVHIWDATWLWGDRVSTDFGNSTELVLDLQKLKNNSEQPLNLSHIYRVAIENRSGAVRIKKVFLSNDGITPAPYTGEPVAVYADNKTIFYGDDIPDLTYSVCGNGNIGEPKVTTTATKTSPVGTYDILISGNTDGVTYNPGKLTIVPAPLIVTANDAVVVRGKDIPGFTLSCDGLRNGETAASAFSEQPIATITATKESPCGKYDITVSGGKAVNYDVTYNDAMLTIIPDQSIILPVDRTSIVATSTEAWDAWSECTWAAPAVTTADGRTAQMVERYEETVATTGKVMEQTVTGLEPGEYKVVLCANAFYTDGRGFDSDLKEGATDVVELYANNVHQAMTAHIGGATSQNDVYTLTNVKVIDGTMRIGMEKLKAGTNWHTLQIKSLTLTKIYSLSESFAQALAKAEELLPQRMLGITRNTLQQAMVAEHTYPNYYLLIDALQQARKSIEAQAYAARALKVWKNELLTATNVCTPKAASYYKRVYKRLEKAYNEDRVSNKTALDIYNPYEGGEKFHNEFVAFMMSAWEYNWDNTPWMQGAPYSVSDLEPFGKDLIPYIDYWSADGYWSTEGKYTLDARTLKATMTDMEPGQYTVTAWVRLRRMNDSNEAPKGIALQVCDGEPIAIGGQQMGDTNYYIDHYTATGIVGSDGVLTIKFNVAADNNVSHLAFKDLWQERGDLSTITANDITITYGDEIPELGYTAQGDAFEGEPMLSTTATKASPVGTYPITVEKGTVTRHAVNYVTGTLTIKKAPLTVGVKGETIAKGDDIPKFTVSYEGFVNGETEAVLTKQPTVTCEATTTSAPGEYAVNVAGAEAENYEISYVPGKLTVTGADDGIIAGDINGNDEVDDEDVDAFIELYLDDEIPEPGDADFKRFDANGDGIISLADAVAIFYLSNGLNFDGTDPNAARAATPMDNGQWIIDNDYNLTVEATELGNGIVRYTLTSDFEYAGFAIDVKGAQVVGESAEGMTLRSADTKGKHRIVAYNFGQAADAGTVLTLDVLGEAQFSNINFSDANARNIRFRLSETTGIGAKLMDNGQWIMDNYYDLNGHEWKSMKKGVNIIRNGNGGTMKLMKR